MSDIIAQKFALEFAFELPLNPKDNTYDGDTRQPCIKRDVTNSEMYHCNTRMFM